MSGVFAYVPVFYTSCASVKATGILVDGNYTLTLSGHSFTVYCNNMAGTPAEYITPTYTYNSGYGSNNFGLFACGGACSGSDVKTNYNRIRFDPSTMEISLTDKTFSYQPVASNTYSGQGILGRAADCRAMNSAAGQGQLDLRGTPFAIDDSVIVAVVPNDGVNGYYPGGSVNMDASRKYYYVTGGGYCGWCGPMNSNGSARYSIKLKFDN